MSSWSPPERLSADEVHTRSAELLSTPAHEVDEREDVFRIEAAGLEWDMGLMVYEPREDGVRMPDGAKCGVFMLHGGSGDYRAVEPFARLIAARLGVKVVSMTYPGRLHLDTPDRDWPGDTINDDGTVRTPHWLAGEQIPPDHYTVETDTSMRERYGTRTVARAVAGSRFEARLASWPLAFERGMIEACARHLDEHTIIVHGHSTGGPFVSMLSQRVPNIGGIGAIENSPFGAIQERARLHTGNTERRAAGKPERSLEEARWTLPFNELSIRTWREEARYAGPEAAARDGADALLRLPELMENVFDAWKRVRSQANFKCEYLITRNIEGSLADAARHTAGRLGYGDEETAGLVDHYLGFTRPLAVPDAKPVPPTLFGITAASRDHPESVYREVVLPAFADMAPPPRTGLTVYGAGVHDYTKPEPGLPHGVAPAVLTTWREAIDRGFFS